MLSIPHCLDNRLTSQVKVKVILRPTVCRSVRLGIRNPPGTRDQFFPFSIFFTVKGSLIWGALSDEKSGQYFSVFPGIASATGLMSIVYCLYFLDSPQPGGSGSCIYFPQEQIVVSLMRRPRTPQKHFLVPISLRS
jgi:hypothetical protein